MPEFKMKIKKSNGLWRTWCPICDKSPYLEWYNTFKMALNDTLHHIKYHAAST